MLAVESPPDDPQAAGLRLSDRQLADLMVYRDLLSTWNGRINLVGPSTMAQFWTRHVADSAQLLELAPAATSWTDLGSGAGLPGVVLAILLKGRTGAHVHLVESLAKRCRFLSEVVESLRLPATVHNARAEQLRPVPFADMVTARAVAPLDRLLGLAKPYLGDGSRALFLKGRTAAAELDVAQARWRFGSALHPSKTDAEARIVEVWGLHGV